MSEEPWILRGFGVEDAAIGRRGARAGLGEGMSGARASPVHSTPVRAEAACDHRLPFRTDRRPAAVGGEVALELRVAGVSFVEGNERSDRARAEQVVSRIVVVSRIAEEGGERQFR